jgi:hypothetical protein
LFLYDLLLHFSYIAALKAGRTDFQKKHLTLQFNLYAVDINVKRLGGIDLHFAPDIVECNTREHRVDKGLPIFIFRAKGKF